MRAESALKLVKTFVEIVEVGWMGCGGETKDADEAGGGSRVGRAALRLA
jgi:hypothetical protein